MLHDLIKDIHYTKEKFPNIDAIIINPRTKLELKKELYEMNGHLDFTKYNMTRDYKLFLGLVMFESNDVEDYELIEVHYNGSFRHITKLEKARERADACRNLTRNQFESIFGSKVFEPSDVDDEEIIESTY